VRPKTRLPGDPFREGHSRDENLLIKTGIKRSDSHPNHEHGPLYDGFPHQGLSEARQPGFFILLSKVST